MIVQRSGWYWFWYWVFCWLLVPLGMALWQRAGLRILIYSDRIVLEKGVLSKQFKELFIRDVRAIDLTQSVWQRMVGTGDLKIATAGTDSYEDQVDGIAKAREVRELLVSLRRKTEKTATSSTD
jgi:uncharacterized membrane protein YdbT with pleckstrin-like domain